MPIDTSLAMRQYTRYAWARDNGHAKYVEKADKCDRFVRGDQWNPTDKALLDAVRRPALTMNVLLPTVANILGEQISNRAEISFRPRSGAPVDTADALTKVFKQISDVNQLDWKRSDMFADGVITGRGFLDARIGYDDSMTGEVQITHLNPKNVVIDPDGEEYDPDTWSEVFYTKWVTADDIAILYSREDAELLRNREQSFFPYGYDSIQAFRDRFGDRNNPMYAGDYDNSSVMRNIRIIERQHRTLDKQKHFVTGMGDLRPVPEDFDRNRIAFFVEKLGLKVTTKLVHRIRWTVIADNVRLHDDWSPYKHFTVVPYFPHFRRGSTTGMVENLLDPQELLNKSTSQELHVVNTTANSGYKVRAGALTNMTAAELEEKGAMSGIVVEVNGDPDKDLVKIQPNQIPQGLDRVAFKAEEFVKTISGVSDSMKGFDRADVAAKAIQAKQKAGSTNLIKPFDNLSRTDFILARNVLDLVQEFYTDERLMTITHDQTTGETENFSVNQATAEGEILNDLTLGEYDVVVTSVPHRETLEDSQFEQAMALREAGVSIPDTVLIDSSRLMNKKDIIRQIQASQTSPEAQAAQALQQRMQAAELSKTEGEAAQKHADADLRKAKTRETMVKAEVLANTPPDAGDGGAGAELAQLDSALKLHAAGLTEDDAAHSRQMDLLNHGLEVRKHEDEMAMRDKEAQAQARAAEVQQAQDAAAQSMTAE